jgi:hypothetical protein
VDNNPRLVKTANNKPTDIEGRLYAFSKNQQVSLAIREKISNLSNNKTGILGLKTAKNRE